MRFMNRSNGIIVKLFTLIQKGPNETTELRTEIRRIEVKENLIFLYPDLTEEEIALGMGDNEPIILDRTKHFQINTLEFIEIKEAEE